jgi:plastocyanin
VRRFPALAAPLVALAAAALVGAGCGGEDEQPGRTVTVPAGQTIRVVGDEYRFDPETVVVEGAAGGGRPAEVRLELVNEGALAHNLRVFDGDRELGGTPTFQGGGKTRDGAVRLEPGTYELICTVGNHEELGMTGRLEVR